VVFQFYPRSTELKHLDTLLKVKKLSILFKINERVVVFLGALAFVNFQFYPRSTWSKAQYLYTK